MRKYAYLAKLEELLTALPVQERQDALNYYEEYFDAAGNENEERTAAELGDPAEVARKILEGEGIDAGEPVKSEPEQQAAALEKETGGEKPDETADGATQAVTPPAGPEPPELDDPEQYPEKGVEKLKKGVGRYSRRIWLIFWLLVVLALIIQVAALLLGLGGLGGSSASLTAESAAVSMEVAESAPVEVVDSGLDASEPVTYSGTLSAPGEGVLYVNMTRGNIDFKTGEEATVEVRNVDVNNKVSYSRTVDYGYVFVCDSVDPDTHVTITLPPDAYERIEISVSNSGAIDLGNLQIRSITAYTASGPVQSGQVRTENLQVTTDIGNISLGKISDGTDYRVKTVVLSAPSGSVTAGFGASREQWQTDITAPEGMTETEGQNEGTELESRSLKVTAARTVSLQYGAS